MIFETNKNRQEIGYRNFLEVHLKETSRDKNKKSTIKLYIILALFSAVMIIYPNTRWVGILTIVLTIIIPFVYKFMMHISKKNAKKLTLPETFDRVEHEFGENYELRTYYSGGSENIVKYEYSDIFKIIESEEFFYIYVNPYSAMPLDKQSIENIEEFKLFVRNKGVFLRELSGNEN